MDFFNQSFSIGVLQEYTFIIEIQYSCTQHETDETWLGSLTFLSVSKIRLYTFSIPQQCIYSNFFLIGVNKIISYFLILSPFYELSGKLNFHHVVLLFLEIIVFCHIWHMKLPKKCIYNEKNIEKNLLSYFIFSIIKRITNSFWYQSHRLVWKIDVIARNFRSFVYCLLHKLLSWYFRHFNPSNVNLI